ncbi:hypothetical protein Hamer_G027965, partial [Homarus americanus]
IQQELLGNVGKEITDQELEDLARFQEEEEKDEEDQQSIKEGMSLAAVGQLYNVKDSTARTITLKRKKISCQCSTKGQPVREKAMKRCGMKFVFVDRGPASKGVVVESNTRGAGLQATEQVWNMDLNRFVLEKDASDFHRLKKNRGNLVIQGSYDRLHGKKPHAFKHRDMSLLPVFWMYKGAWTTSHLFSTVSTIVSCQRPNATCTQKRIGVWHPANPR